MANYVILQTISLSADTASVTFANIPQSGYTDLKIVVSARTGRSSDGDYIYLSLNGSQAGSGRYLKGSATSLETGTVTDNYLSVPSANNTSNMFGSLEIYIPDYLSTVAKSISVNNGYGDTASGSSTETFGTAIWSSGSASTSAITSITLAGRFASFIANTTFSLYGISAYGTTPTIAPKASGGNRISTDGTYWYHTFLTSGYFTPVVSLSSNYYVLGGGATGSGGGSSGSGGGGGGGGSSYVTSSNLTTQNYAVTIGAGGPTGGSAATAGSVGNNSTFNSTTGGGGQQQASFSVASPGGTGTTQNGGAGGRGFNSGNAENGGAGYTNPLDSVARGGGGGGSTKSGTQGTGTNGGGNGIATGTGGNANANTGGGGGGSAEDNVGYGGAGGSGIVIIRYAV